MAQRAFTVNRYGAKLLFGLVIYCAWVIPCAAQMLETETARLLQRGAGKAGGAFEVQTASEGREGALPLLFEYGLTDALELTVEPVPYATIRPAESSGATGPGDAEITLTYGFLPEQGHRPAMAFAAEFKVPTAHDDLIGTGQADYTAYYIVSKKFGQRTDMHFNAAYAFLGSPPGVSLNNVFSGAVAAVYHFGDRTQLFGEVLGSTAASSEGEGGDTVPGGITTIVPEAAGSELVGTAGLGWNVSPRTLIYSGLSYDNTSAVQLRAGFTVRWGNPAVPAQPAR